jgi:hypothetical protein
MPGCLFQGGSTSNLLLRHRGYPNRLLAPTTQQRPQRIAADKSAPAERDRSQLASLNQFVQLGSTGPSELADLVNRISERIRPSVRPRPLARQ